MRDIIDEYGKIIIALIVGAVVLGLVAYFTTATEALGQNGLHSVLGY